MYGGFLILPTTNRKFISELNYHLWRTYLLQSRIKWEKITTEQEEDVSFSFHDLCFLMINEGSTNTYKLSNFACRGQKKAPPFVKYKPESLRVTVSMEPRERDNLNGNFHLRISSDNFNFRNMWFCLFQIFCNFLCIFT